MMDEQDLQGIAIIGMSGRFPGAPDVDRFWENLRSGVESITFFRDEELIAAGVDPEVLKAPNYVKASPILDDIDRFDASFFGFSPAEARMLDPQHRLLLECAWKALEDAAYVSETYPGAIGMFCTGGSSGYLYNNVLANRSPVDLGLYGMKMNALQAFFNNLGDYLSTRVSFKLNLRGPSLTVQTACSSSLVAVHLACQSLLAGECEMALAGGATLKIPHKRGYFFEEGSILSPDGHCRSFDEQAQGTIFGSAVALVVLKPLENALRDGDRIRAVIRGSAVNNDGNLKMSYTAPSVDAQSRAVAEALLVAGTPADTIGYVECHGTATQLGEPIEIAALSQAFRRETKRRHFCAIGSVKTNVGHLDHVAGIAGLIKTVLALEHAEIPPSLHFNRPNPQIDFESSPFFVNRELRTWTAEGGPRRAGLTSVGAGGTNVHMILEEAPRVEPPAAPGPWSLVPISGNTEADLDRITGALARHLEANPDLNLADVAYTLQTGRRPHGHRRVVVARDAADAAQVLGAAHARRLSQVAAPEPPEVVFMFSGQGAQYVGMGRGLYERGGVFRERLDACCDLLARHLGRDLRELLYPREGTPTDMAGRLRATEIAQPALFAVEYALAEQWRAWGVRPAAMIGHSIGEYVAACLAGVFTLEDALAVVAARGRLMQQMERGAMLSVPLSEEALAPLLGDGIDLAAVNEPARCVVAGREADIAALERRLAGEVTTRRLHTSHAFHSAMMDPVIGPFTEVVRRVRLRAPQLRCISNVTGTWMTEAQATSPEYWAQHLRRPVLFSHGIRELLRQPGRALLEVGPGRVLSTLAGRHAQGGSMCAVISSLPAKDIAAAGADPAAEVAADEEAVLTAQGRLWLAGVEIDWQATHAPDTRRRIGLPTYPFAGERYWIQEPRRDAAAAAPGGGREGDEPFGADEGIFAPVWKRAAAPPQAAGGAPSASWLIFLDTAGLGAELARRLRGEGHRVATVQRDTCFRRTGEDAYGIDPLDEGDYGRLLDALGSAAGAAPRSALRVAHLWHLEPEGELDEQGRRAAGGRGLFALAAAIGRQAQIGEAQLLVVTHGLHAIAEEPAPSTASAEALDACRAIPREFPRIGCRNIDVLRPQPRSFQARRLVEGLIAEVLSGATEPRVAYRGGQRWAAALEPVEPRRGPSSGADARPSPAPPGLPRGAHCAVLGDLSGAGAALASALAREVGAKLLLVAASPAPDALVGHLEQLGAEVERASAELLDASGLRSALSRGRARFGDLHGVFVAMGPDAATAGSGTGAAPLTASEPRGEGAARQLEAVAEALRGAAGPDCCVVQLGVAAMLGDRAEIVPAGASASAEAFALRQCQTGSIPWITVYWDATGPDRLIQAVDGALRGALPPVLVVLGGPLRRAGEGEAAQPSPQRAAHGRPALPVSYVAPRTSVEEALAGVWQAVLGIDAVGVHDNFFDLGGDSVIGVQIAARAERVGLRITPKQVFEHSTIGELSAVAVPIAVNPAEQGPVVGGVPMSPSMRRVLEVYEDPARFSAMPVRLDWRVPPEPGLLRQALQRLSVHHDALRMSLHQDEEGVGLYSADAGEEVHLEHVDLSAMSAAQQASAMQQVEARLAASVSRPGEPSMRAALFDRGRAFPSRLSLVFSHFIADLAAERVAIADLQALYAALARGQKPVLPPKTTSFRTWSEKVAALAGAPELDHEVEFWLSKARTPVRPLPRDFQGPSAAPGRSDVVVVTLDTHDTKALIEVQQAHHTRVETVLLAATTRALQRWTGEPRVALDLEGQGREVPLPQVDLSRTFGWFTTVFPMVFELPADYTAAGDLKALKEQLRSIPREGLGHGLLRYASDDERSAALRAQARPEVLFVYLGTHTDADMELFTQASDADLPGYFSGFRADRRLLEIIGLISREQLTIFFTYQQSAYRRATIDALGAAVVECLRAIIAGCASTDATLLTPHDFPGTDLTADDLSDLIDEFKVK